MAQYLPPESLKVGNGVETVFGFTFPYLRATDLALTVDGAATPVVLVGTAQVSINPAPSFGAKIRIFRDTPAQFPKFLFSGGIPMLPRYIDDNNRQLLYALQEGLLAFAQVREESQEGLAHTLRVPLSEPRIPELPAAANRVNRLLSFDALGQPVLSIPAAGSVTEFMQWLSQSDVAQRGDTVVGHYVANGVGGVTVNAELIARGLRPESFGAKADGSDATAGLQRWVDACVATGATGVATNGAVYTVFGTVSKQLIEGQSLRIDWNGAELKQGADNVVLSLTNTATGAIVSASNIHEDGVALGNGGTQTRVMVMTVPGHPFTEVGQIGKIFSDDLVPDSDGANQLIGEFFSVGKIIDANTIATTGTFDETYVTNPRVVRPSNAHLSLHDLVGFSVLDNVRNASFVNVTGFLSPVLTGKAACRDINGVFLNLTGNCRATVDALTSFRNKNRPDQSAYGYVVNDSAGWYSWINNLNASYARHAYTTSTPTSTVPGDDRWGLRGRTIGSTVQDGRALGCANAFDTHSPALRIRFVNCTPVDDFRGYDTGGAGIQIRARDCEVLNCDVTRSKFGVAVSGANKTGPSYTRVTGLRYRGPQGHTPVRVLGHAVHPMTVYVDDSQIRTEATEAFDIGNARLVLRGTDVVMSPVANGACLAVLRTGAKIELNGGTYELTSGNTHTIVRHDADNTTADVDGLRCIGVSARLQYLATSASQYLNVVSRYNDIALDAALPGNPFSGFPATTPKISADFRIGYNTRPLVYRQQVYSTPGSKSIDLQYVGSPSIFLRLEAQVEGVQLAALTQGAFQGQLLTVNCRDTSAANLVVQTSSAGRLQLGSGATLRPGEGLTVIWDGASWRSTSQHRA